MKLFLFLAMAAVVEAKFRRSAPLPSDPVIVVGGGLAGLSAALEALDAGAEVIVIDKEKSTGGNSAKASSGISACGTPAQEHLGIIDSPAQFYLDTLSAGDRENNEALVDVLVHNSAKAIEFLESADINLGDVNLCGGHTVPRTHWVPSPKEGKPIPVGFEIMKKLRAKLDKIKEERPNAVTYYFEAKVLGMTSWNEYMTGVTIELANGTREEINGKAIILATGGFSADTEEDGLLREYAPEAAKFPTTNGGFAKGEGVKMARAMGAGTVGMSNVQIHPTAFVDPAAPSANTKFLAAEALRGKGAILLSPEGKRFGNELGRRDYLTEKILKFSGPVEKFQGGSAGLNAAIMLMNDAAIDSFGRPAFNFYHVIKKFFTKYENIKSFAEAANIPVEKATATIESYNAFYGIENKKADDFGKTVFPVKFNADEPIYAAIVTPAIHYTMGGLQIDTNARVYSTFREAPFKGLYAAGEVAGGVHGSNRLAGNSLLECVVFGRIAGRNAAKLVYDRTEL